MSTFILIVIIVAFVGGSVLGLMLGFSRAMREAANRLQETTRPIIARLFVILGCIFLVGALATSLHTWRFTHIAQRTTGTVIALRQQTNKDTDGFVYAPTVRFEDAGGVQYTVSSSLYSSPPEFQVGDAVAVLYRGDDPQSARIDRYSQLWGLPTVLGILGTSQLFVGLVLLFWRKLTERFRTQKLDAQII